MLGKFGIKLPLNVSKGDTDTSWIGPDDAPELTDEFFRQADEFVGNSLVRRDRPKAAIIQKSLLVRYDQHITPAFKATGKGWQSRMNNALRDWFKFRWMI